MGEEFKHQEEAMLCKHGNPISCELCVAEGIAINHIQECFGEDVKLADFEVGAETTGRLKKNITISAENSDDGKDHSVELAGSFSMDKEGKEGQDQHFVISIKDGYIQYEDKRINIKEVLPEDVGLQVDNTKNNYFRRVENDRHINLKGLSSFEDLLTLLHETGHVIDSERHPMDDPKRHRLSDTDTSLLILGKLPKGLSKEDAQAALDETERSEKVAWFAGSLLAKKINLPIETSIEARREECLSTYDYALNLLRSPGGRFRWATKEMKDKLRSPEGVEAANIMTSLETRLSEIKDLAKKYVPEVLGKFIVRVAGGTVEIEGIDSDDTGFKVTINKQSDNKNGFMLLTLTPETLLAGMAEYKNFQMENEVNTAIHFEPDAKIGRDEVDKAKEISDAILANMNINEIIISLYRKYHPEAKEPFNVNPQTGERLTLDETIESMKRDSSA